MSDLRLDADARHVDRQALVRQRAYMFVVVGQAVSQLGNTAFKVGLAFSSLALDSSGVLLPQIFVAQGVGMLASLGIGGVLSDRRSARSIVFLSDVVRLFLVLIVTGLFAAGHAASWHLLALGLGFGLVEGVFQPAMGAATPELLPADLLPSGNAFRTALWRGVSLVGGPLGALLVVVNVETAFAVNALTFAVALAALLIGGRWPHPHEGSRQRQNMLVELRGGIAFVGRAKWLLGLIGNSCAMVVFVFAGSFSVLPLVLADRSAGAFSYGLLLTVTALGGLVAGLVMMRLGSPRAAGAVFLWSSVLVVVAYGGLLWSSNLIVLVALGALAGAATAAASIVYSNVLQTLVPREMLGRVSSVDMLGSFALIPVAQAGLAWCVALWSPRSVYAVSLAVALVVGLSALVFGPVRHLTVATADAKGS